jgi:NAD(P)-dependent dehydrogenase (short-subunit alcohol dehydrogenase family)
MATHHQETAMNRLDGKVAIVTGAALGLGAAMVTRMTEEGAAVALLDQVDTQGKALAQLLQTRDPRAE